MSFACWLGGYQFNMPKINITKRCFIKSVTIERERERMSKSDNKKQKLFWKISLEKIRATRNYDIYTIFEYSSTKLYFKIISLFSVPFSLVFPFQLISFKHKFDKTSFEPVSWLQQYSFQTGQSLKVEWGLFKEWSKHKISFKLMFLNITSHPWNLSCFQVNPWS